MSEYQVIDLETTSIYPNQGAIVEIGVCTVNTITKVITPNMSYIIKPDKNFDRNAWIFSHSSLRPALVDQGVSLEQVREELQSLLNSGIFTSFNQGFDFGWLEHNGFKIGRTTTDLQYAAQCHFQNGYRLSVVQTLAFCNINEPEPHRALGDAVLEAKILLYLDEHGGWS